MSQTQSKSQDSNAKQKKTVQIVGYAPTDKFDSERDMANLLDPDTDYYERTRKTNRSVEIVYVDEDGEEADRQSIFRDDIRDELVEHGIVSDRLHVEEEIETRRPYANSPTKVVQSAAERICGRLPTELSGGIRNSDYSLQRWQDDQLITLVRVTSGSVDYRRVLVHHTKRGGRKKYDSDRKHLSMDFTIELGPDRPDMIDDWTDEIVEPFIKFLQKEPWCERVRVTDCAETVEKEGDCFDI